MGLVFSLSVLLPQKVFSEPLVYGLLDLGFAAPELTNQLLLLATWSRLFCDRSQRGQL